jgi:hypothetical protein
VKPLREVRRAWRLYQTDDPWETALAVVLVAVALFPFIMTWWQMRSDGGGRNV